MRIGIACAAAMFVALWGSGAALVEALALVACAFMGGHSLASKLDAIARACDRE